jgi:hypothetical protein
VQGVCFFPNREGDRTTKAGAGTDSERGVPVICAGQALRDGSAVGGPQPLAPFFGGPVDQIAPQPSQSRLLGFGLEFESELCDLEVG